MKKILFAICVLILLLIVCANLCGCGKEHIPAPKQCGTVWDKGKNQSGRYELTVDDRTIGVDSITWVQTIIGQQYCQ